MDEITTAILQNEVLRRENPALSLDGSSSALMIFEGAGGSRRSDRGLQGGRSKSKIRDPSKIRCHRYDKLGHRVKNYPQLKDRMRTIGATANSKSEDDVLEISDEVFTSF